MDDTIDNLHHRAPMGKMDASKASCSAPLYLRIKQMIIQRIADGLWAHEQRIPSENELVRELGVSRMTIHRALRELTREGVLLRSQGVGTFVAPLKPESSLLAIRNIADDIRARDHHHDCEIILKRVEPVSAQLAADFEIARETSVYHTICVHRENGVPIQLEDRFVNPKAVPHYLDQDFTMTTPTEVLNRAVPVPEIRHVIEAISADEEIANHLDITCGAPCLQMCRTTWNGQLPVTFVKLVHAGARYRLSGRFTPGQG